MLEELLRKKILVAFINDSSVYISYRRISCLASKQPVFEQPLGGCYNHTPYGTRVNFGKFLRQHPCRGTFFRVFLLGHECFSGSFLFLFFRLLATL